jgi:hypothetical protein
MKLIDIFSIIMPIIDYEKFDKGPLQIRLNAFL